MPLADRALVVGISQYPGISNLSGPETDAKEFYDWVTSPTGGGVDPQNATLIVSSKYQPVPSTALGALPAQEQIHDFFTTIDIAASANNDEGTGLGLRAGRRLWMFFSGHGFAPSLEMSGVLMANATLKRIFNIGAVRWADRLFEGGWFDQVLLFQDACRNRIPTADLDGLFLLPRVASPTQKRERFHAFSSRDQQLSKEVVFPDGKTRGVFTATLLEGLRGGARDPVTGAITARNLRTYLQDNMESKLPAADKANPDIAKEPDVRDYFAFDIVPAPSIPPVPPVSPVHPPPPASPSPAAASPKPAGLPSPAVATPPVTSPSEQYSVNIAMPAPGLSATLENGRFEAIKTEVVAGQVWSIKLPRGIYRVVVPGQTETIFAVTGPGGGAEGAIDVRV
jgi:uncharacterized caspase-like protein